MRVTHRPPSDVRARYRAAIALGRALGLSLKDARALLLAAPVVLPRALPAAEAEDLCQKLTAAGTPAQPVPAPASCLFCPAHPALFRDGACQRCETWLCALCRAHAGTSLCPGCAGRARFFRQFKAVRVVFLLGILLGVGAWALNDWRWRHARAGWEHTLLVDVVLLQHGAAGPESLQALRAGVPRLERALAEEERRYRPAGPPPFSFTVQGPVPVAEQAPRPPEDGGFPARVEHYLRLRRYLADVQARGRLDLGRRSLRLYVLVEPVRSRVRFVEGFGVSGGDLGFVRAVVDENTVDQALLAIGHELLHCLGATDKYDADGHAVETAGLAEPGLVPRYPQRFAEIMVGEVPLSRGDGRLVDSLAEVRVGPATAAEIGWGVSR